MAYVSKINGYVIKDTEAHNRLDAVEQKLVEGVGKIDEIHVNNTKIPISTDGKKSVNIAVDGTYNANTNKVATVETVTSKVDAAVQGILGEGVSEAYDTFKEMQEYIEEHGTEAVGMANNITQNTKDIDALEAEVDSLGLAETYDETAETLSFSLGKGGTASSGGSTGGGAGKYIHYISARVHYGEDVQPEEGGTFDDICFMYITNRKTTFSLMTRELLEDMFTTLNHSSEPIPATGTIYAISQVQAGKYTFHGRRPVVGIASTGFSFILKASQDSGGINIEHSCYPLYNAEGNYETSGYSYLDVTSDNVVPL